MAYCSPNTKLFFIVPALLLFALSGCRNQSETLVGTWRGNFDYDGKQREWVYEFDNDDEFKYQAFDRNGQRVSGGNGKYSFADGKVAIKWPSGEWENASITWVSPDEFQYLIISHSDKNQVGLTITFRRSAPVDASSGSFSSAKTATEEWVFKPSDEEEQMMQGKPLTKAALTLTGTTFELRTWVAKPKEQVIGRGIAAPTGSGPGDPAPDYVMKGKAVINGSKITLVADSKEDSTLTEADKKPMVLVKEADGTLKSEEGLIFSKAKEK
jgi:hypothetical protein